MPIGGNEKNRTKSLPISHRAEFLEWNTTPVLPDEEAGATAAKVLPEFAK